MPNAQGKGTYQVSVTVRGPKDCSNADILRFAIWPGTAEGSTPPATWDEAFEHARKMIDTVKDLPSEGVCEIRITTFAQGGEDDPLAGEE